MMSKYQIVPEERRKVLVMSKYISREHRLRVRLSKYSDGSISTEIFHYDDRDRVIWECPIPAEIAQELDWTVNAFGYKRVAGGWEGYGTPVDYNEPARLVAWVQRHQKWLNE